MKLMSIFLLIFSSSFSFANTSLDLIHTAKAVKAILDRGYALPAVVDVIKVDQMSIPPKSCILVVYDRKPNTECPEEIEMIPNLDKGYVACFESSSEEVDSILEVNSSCPPPL